MYTLHHGDCLDILPTLPAQSVDAIIADPPYGTTACKWDSVIPLEAMWRELKRVVKSRGAVVLFAAQPFTSALVMSNAKQFRYEWIWRKNEGSSFAASRYAPIKYHESILVFGGSTYNPQETPRLSEQSRYRMRTPVGKGNAQRAHGTLRNMGNVQYNNEYKMPESVLEVKCVPNGGGHKLHPTQKPVELLRYLIRTYTNPGETVLDFTMGSGTTGVACAMEGRHFIGIEKDDHYFTVATDRIEQVQPALMEAAD